MANLVGQRFQYLVVIRKCGTRGHISLWECKCDCGNTVVRDAGTLKRNNVSSCGCMRGKSQIIDLTGMTFGWLTVLHRDEDQNEKRRIYWICECKCGKVKSIRGADLKNGKTLSCGCYHELEVSNRVKITGMSHTKIHRIHHEMKQRCNNPNNKAFANYGGRGIRVCDEWNDRYGFKAFYEWALTHGYKEGLSIERKDVNGNYEPSNCMWIESKKQASNKRNNVLISYKGITHTLAQWGRITGLDTRLIKRRMRDNRLDEILGEYSTSELLSSDEILFP